MTTPDDDEFIIRPTDIEPKAGRWIRLWPARRARQAVRLFSKRRRGRAGQRLKPSAEALALALETRGGDDEA